MNSVIRPSRITTLALLFGALAPIACSSESAPAPAPEVTPAAAASASGARAKYEPAFVEGTPGSVCSLHPEGNTDPSASLPAAIDEDGVARFQAVRATAAEAVQRLALDCTDASGKATTYAVDLRADATFAPHPFDGSRMNLEARPALEGDPLRFTQEELIQRGYGLRPDPKGNPAGYARWLAAARVSAYKVPGATRSSSKLVSPATYAKASGVTPDIATTSKGAEYPGWTGAVLSGKYSEGSTSATSVTYAANEATFVVPSVVPSAYGIKGTYVSIWNGLGQYSNQLVQDEVWVSTNSTASTYFINTQVFSASSTQSKYVNAGTRFTPTAGDQIRVEEWYCDSSGNVNMAGGYACTTITDLSSGLFWDCTQAASTVCASVVLNPADMANGIIGTTAEFIIENDNSEDGNVQGQWPDFAAPVEMAGSALVVTGNTTQDGWVTVETDPAINMMEDFMPASNPDHIKASIDIPVPNAAAEAGSGQVNWSVTQGEPHVPGDVNGDGWADIALTGFPGWNTLPVALSSGNGTFISTNASASLIGAAATQGGAKPFMGDFNGDGLTDVALVGGGPNWNTIPIAFSNGPGALAPATTGSGFTVTNDEVAGFPVYAIQPGAQMVVGDFNGDGKADFAAACGTGWNTVPVALSNGNGTFNVSNIGNATFPVYAAESGARLVAADFNGDGRADLALTGGANWNTIPVAFSNGNGYFTTENIAAPGAFAVSATQSPMIVTGDFNGDGKGDIALAGGPAWATVAIAFAQGNGSPTGTIFVETNVAGGSFATWADEGSQLVAGDYNGDGLTDLALVGGSSTPNNGAPWGSIPVAFSNGNGSFQVTNGGAGLFTTYAAEQSCSGSTCARPTAVSASQTR